MPKALRTSKLGIHGFTYLPPTSIQYQPYKSDEANLQVHPI